MKVAVVGGGIHGLSAGRFLSLRGHEVTLYERHGLLHDRGSSHGESRIVRRAYPDRLYTAIMLEAYPLWEDLQRESGLRLLHEVGLLTFGLKDSPTISSTIEALEDNQVPYELVEEHPSICLEPSEIGILTRDAGWVSADLSLLATLEVAKRAGMNWLGDTEADPFALSREFGAVVLCAGAWISKYVDLPVTVKKMTIGYLQAPLAGPVWIEDSPDMLYGFPATELGTKVGVHRGGVPIDPDAPDRSPDRGSLQAIRDFGRRRLGIDASVEHAKGCLYTVAPNEDFLLGQLKPNIFYASACSGHGFKFGPWIGRLLADFVEGSSSPSRYPRFHKSAEPRVPI